MSTGCSEGKRSKQLQRRTWKSQIWKIWEMAPFSFIKHDRLDRASGSRSLQSAVRWELGGHTTELISPYLCHFSFYCLNNFILALMGDRLYYFKRSFHLTQCSHILFCISSFFPFYRLPNHAGLSQLFFLLSFCSSTYDCCDVQIWTILERVLKRQAGILITGIKRRTNTSESSAR